MHHFTLCGLPYVYLKNGYEHSVKYGERVISYTDIDGLHDLLAEILVFLRRPLSGKEHRFLRMYVAIAIDDEATLLDMDPVALRAIERLEQRACPLRADLFTRMFAYKKLTGEEENRTVIESRRALRVGSPKDAVVLFWDETKARWKNDSSATVISFNDFRKPKR